MERHIHPISTYKLRQKSDKKQRNLRIQYIHQKALSNQWQEPYLFPSLFGFEIKQWLFLLISLIGQIKEISCSKIFDDGTSRKIVEMEDGSKALLITYSSGGATPGDSYLWILDENNLPKAWKLWVSIIPWGGLEFSWEEWQTLETGVKVSTKHHSFVRDVNLSDIKAAENLSDLMEEDPFAELQ